MTLDPLRRILNVCSPSPSLVLVLGTTWPNSWRSSISYHSDTVSISRCVWWCAPLWPVSARNTFVTLSILCQHYLGGTGASSCCEWPRRSTSQEKELFSGKELSPWPVKASGTLFHKTLQTTTNRKAFKQALKTCILIYTSLWLLYRWNNFFYNL